MSAPSSDRRNVGADVTQSSVGELLGEVSRDLAQLMRQEVELAKAELRQDAKQAGRAAGMYSGAGLAVYMVLLFVSIAAWWALSNVMDRSWAALILAGIWAVIGAILFAIARARMRRVTGLRRTAETVREVPEALKGKSYP
jgi:hypothetical protein